MNGAFEHFWDSVRRVLEYPFLTLGGGSLSLAVILKLLLLLGLVLTAEYLLRRYFTMRLLKRTPLHPPLQYAIARIGGYLFIVIGFYLSLMAVGVNLSSLAVVAGAVGVGIGFGLQNIVHNFVSGIIILVEQPIALGDRVEVSGVAGRVARIRLRSTEVITNDNISIIVPNSDFIAHPVTNWSHGDPRVQMRIPVGVAYGADVAKLRTLLLEIAAENPKVLKSPEATVYFAAFGDNALLFELGVWTSDMAHSPRRFRSELNFAIERKLRENNIQIPFPQRDIHLRSGTFVLQTNAAASHETESGTVSRSVHLI
jgi:small-conductance mechanosensitive channel